MSGWDVLQFLLIALLFMLDRLNFMAIKAVVEIDQLRHGRATEEDGDE